MSTHQVSHSLEGSLPMLTGSPSSSLSRQRWHRQRCTHHSKLAKLRTQVNILNLIKGSEMMIIMELIIME